MGAGYSCGDQQASPHTPLPSAFLPWNFEEEQIIELTQDGSKLPNESQDLHIKLCRLTIKRPDNENKTKIARSKGQFTSV